LKEFVKSTVFALPVDRAAIAIGLLNAHH